MEKYYPQMIEVIQKAVQFNTVLAPAVEGGPFGQGNKDCLEYVLSVAKDLGFRTVNLDGYCGYAEIGEGEEIVGIIGHLDVVPEGDGWKYPPYSGIIAEDAIWGRGTIDDKGPIIISLFKIKALMDEGHTFNKRVRVIFGCNEETGSLCMEHYLKVDEPISYGVSPDANFPVIFAEKTINNIEINGTSKDGKGAKLISLDGGIVINAVPDICKMIIDANGENAHEILQAIQRKLDANSIAHDSTIEGNLISVTAHGKSAHGSVPQEGINAISYAIQSLDGIIDNDFVDLYNTYISTCIHGEKLGCFKEDEYGKIAVNIGLCHYENGEFSIKINSRLPFNYDSNTMFNDIQSTLKGANCAKVTLLSDSQGFVVDKQSQMIQLLTKAYRDVTGDATEPICCAGGTYAREFKNCVAFGPEMEGYGEMIIHQPNERLSLKALDAIAKIYHNAYLDLITKVSFK